MENVKLYEVGGRKILYVLCRKGKYGGRPLSKGHAYVLKSPVVKVHISRGKRNGKDALVKAKERRENNEKHL